ncbi:MAG: HAD-IB family hydrolase [Andreesenia angusta]|nr:HAD-IB family hydrolase [Andreesenia angusta]
MEQKIAFFDFDKTLRGGDSMFDLLIWSLKRYPTKIIPSFFRLTLGSLKFIFSGFKNISVLKNSIFSVVRYLDSDDIEYFSKNILLKKKFYKNGLEEIDNCLNEGYKIFLVSASPEKYLKPLKDILKVDEIIGTIIDDKGNIIGNNCKSFEKVRRIDEILKERNWKIDYENSKGFSDSLSADGPMLNLVKNRYLINSKKRVDGYNNLSWR